MRKVEGIKQEQNKTNKQKTPQRPDHSMVLTRGKEGGGKKKRVKKINGDGRRRLWKVNTKYNIQMMYYRIAHLKPICNCITNVTPINLIKSENKISFCIEILVDSYAVARNNTERSLVSFTHFPPMLLLIAPPRHGH